MAEYRESKTPMMKGKKLHSVEIREAEGGGHIVTHHYKDDGMAFHKPKEFVFGEDEGDDLAQHLGKYVHIKPGKMDNAAEERAEGE